MAASPSQPFRIDLGDPDPGRIEELPGILEPEIDLLLSACGPGRSGFCERLRATGIPAERLRAWAVYLDLPPEPEVPIDARIRSTTEYDAEGLMRSELKVTMSKGPLSARWKGERRDRRKSEAEFRVREAILSVRNWGPAAFWLGTVTAGIVGQDPWRGPMQRSGAGTSSLSHLSIRSSLASRGAVGSYGPLTLAAWRSGNGERGRLVSLTANRGGIWYGTRTGTGEGLGWEIALGWLRAGGQVHRSDEGEASAAVRLKRDGRTPDVFLAWMPESADRRANLRLETGSSSRIESWRLTGRIALLGSPEIGVSGYRGTLRLVDRISNRLSIGFQWDERSTRAQLSRRVVLGHTEIKLGLKGLLRTRESSWLASWGLIRPLSLFDLDLSLLGRGGTGFGWPGVAADGPVAVTARLRSRRTPVAVEVRLLLPLRSIDPLRPSRPAWRLQIEPNLLQDSGDRR